VSGREDDLLASESGCNFYFLRAFLAPGFALVGAALGLGLGFALVSEALALVSATLGMSPMIVFTGHTEKTGHFLQPIAIAIGQRVI
jgi:hypothetical protein